MGATRVLKNSKSKVVCAAAVGTFPNAPTTAAINKPSQIFFALILWLMILS
jgi:hypothetical protein